MVILATGAATSAFSFFSLFSNTNNFTKSIIGKTGSGDTDDDYTTLELNITQTV